MPESFDSGPGLEANVISLLGDIAPEAAVTSADLHAVHRLKKKDRVILKFVTRKKKHAVIVKRAKLKEPATREKHHGNMVLYESMCYQVRHLYYLCSKLKAMNKLSYYSFFNGSLRVKLEEDGASHVIGHIDDLGKITNMARDEIEKLA